MKKCNINKFISRVMASLLLVLVFLSCNEKEDFSSDESYAGLFRPIAFGTYSVDANSVVLTFSKIVGAKKYILEISEDSLLFNSYVRRITFSADTLTEYATSSVETQIIYHVQIDGLSAYQRHSARIMGINSDSTLTSKFMPLTFFTMSENLIAPVTVDGTSATIKWRKTSNADSLYLIDESGINPSQKFKLTSSELQDTSKTVNSLITGGFYTAQLIYNDGKTRIRGYNSFKIAGSSTGYTYNLLPTEDVNTVLSSIATNPTVTLMLNPGSTYNLGTVNVPSGVKVLYFSCPSSTNLPVVNLTKVSPTSDFTGAFFENLNLVGSGSSSTSNILLDLGINLTINFVDFYGCSISAYNGLIRLKSTATISVESISFNKCLVNDIGSTNVINVAGTSSTNQVGNIGFEYSTFINLNTQFADIRCQTSNISVYMCTFYNNSTTNKLSQLFRFTDGSTPTKFSLYGCIFAGGNGGTTLQSFYASYSALATYSFSSSYKTNDMVVSTTAGKLFTSLNALGLSSTELFIDPANGNFRVKPTITLIDFPGKIHVGDPRWWW